MLARSPADGRILDDYSGGVVWKRCELSFACPKTTLGLLPLLLGMKDCYVDV